MEIKDSNIVTVTVTSTGNEITLDKNSKINI